MFLRFSKLADLKNGREKTWKKCVFLGDSVLMEWGNQIVGIAKLHEETEKCFDYDVIVAKNCELGSEKIARYIKDMIGKSNKFSEIPSPKRRKYFVEEFDCEFLPVKAKLQFSHI